MCTTDVYVDVYPDGQRSEYREPTYCTVARNGRACPNPVIYNHSPRAVDYPTPMSGYSASIPVTAAYPYQMPPSPPMSTPRGHSAEAPRYRNDSSSSERNHRSSGVYVNGRKVVELHRKNRTRPERIVIVDSPPTPRTPPRQYASPYTAPPSPNTNAEQFEYTHAPRNSRRPVIVDERPRPQVDIEVIDAVHRRQPSIDSRYSQTSADDEERRRRRHARERKEREDRERERAEEESRRLRMQSRIKEQNARINRRPAVPVPPAPISRSSTGFANVELTSEDQDLVDAVRQMDINQRLAAERQASEDRERQEEAEAQRRRLMERMMPRRRATVGPGSRRHRVLYDDGVYRWE